jgi:drug/metabolite transporter (DMT)-like permease
MNQPSSNSQPAGNDNEAAKAEARFGVTDLWIVLMTVIWGSNFTVIKYAIDDFSPLGFTAVRFTIASAVMLLITLVSGRDLRVSRSDFSKLFSLALLQNVLYQVSFMKGMAHTRAGNAALILATTPLFTAVIGRLRKQEHFTYRGIIGLLLAFAGIGLIVLVGHRGNAPESSVLGDGLLIVATVCWAIYTNLAHRFVHVYGSLKTTTIMMISGTPVLLLVCAPSLVEQDWSRMRPLSWLEVCSGLLSTHSLHHLTTGARLGDTHRGVWQSTPSSHSWWRGPWVRYRQPVGGRRCDHLCGIYLVRGYSNRPEQAAEEEIEEAALGPGKN